MRMLLARFARDESGGTAIEYGLIAAGMSLAIITMISGLGSKLDVAFTSLQSALRLAQCRTAAIAPWAFSCVGVQPDQIRAGTWRGEWRLRQCFECFD